MRTLALDAAALEKLVSAAVAAPSIHNTQPWHFRLRAETSALEVRAVLERALHVTDPEGRAMHLSVGAAVLNIRTAARRMGWAPEVRLLPDPAEPDLLAAVELDQLSHAELPTTGRLFEAIWHRHTVRTPFTGPPVPPTVLAELAEAARAEDAVLTHPGPEETARLLELTAEAERRNTVDPDHRGESRHWLQEPEGPPLGIPPSALGPQDLAGHLPVRDFSALRPADHRPPVPFEAEPCIAVLSTDHDLPADWLHAGLALQHVLLTATVHQVRASLLHQAMEWHDLREAARDPRHGPGHVQMLIRLGYGPEGAPTPRLTGAEVID
ncbi:Acg family FMN-binding oxidoreductase [Kitasatospora camelliae]|uniref:Nitroreductase family protein n=1 Tax=Kitasatospora camelliae TaxID=3156397 RepID=A0AAU8JQ53_9ACTN